MKIIAITLFAAALAFAQSGTTSSNAATAKRQAAAKAKPPSVQSKPVQTPKRTPAAAPAPAPTIPAGATEVGPDLYRFTDPSGKTWNYRRTPFGISKWQDDPSASAAKPAPTQAQANPVVVTDLGDSYRFEKKTPFGGATWVRKKSQLSDEEKELVKPADSTVPPAASPAVSKAVNTHNEDK